MRPLLACLLLAGCVQVGSEPPTSEADADPGRPRYLDLPPVHMTTGGMPGYWPAWSVKVVSAFDHATRQPAAPGGLGACAGDGCGGREPILPGSVDRVRVEIHNLHDTAFEEFNATMHLAGGLRLVNGTDSFLGTLPANGTWFLADLQMVEVGLHEVHVEVTRHEYALRKLHHVYDVCPPPCAAE